MKTVKFNLKNLGYIDEGSIELGKLTVLCGKNNTGKTYINIAIYAFLKFLNQGRQSFFFNGHKSKIEELFKNGFINMDLKEFEVNVKKYLDKISKKYSLSLDSVFSSPENEFNKSKINIEIPNFKFDYSNPINSILSLNKNDILSIKKEEESTILTISFLDTKTEQRPPKDIIENFLSQNIVQIFFKDYFKKPFPVTSERTGIQLFWRELDIKKNVLIDQIVKNGDKNFDPFEYLFNSVSRYPVSIHDNIDYVRDYENIRKKNSFIFNDRDKYKQIIKSLEDVLGGSFKYINKSFIYCPKKERNRDKVTLPLYLTSSAVKSLFSLDLYLRHIAQKDDLLIIDEPELNLHPDNQRKMAKLIAVLVNAGINVFVTTHSDYFIKEVNNLIMLSNDFREKKDIMKKFKYKKNEVLTPSDVNLYLIENHTTNKIKIDKDGMNLEVFDKIILEQNEACDSIYYALGD